LRKKGCNVWRKSDKTQVKNLFVINEIVQKPIDYPTKNGVRRAANAVTEKLRRTKFFERKMKKINKFTDRRAYFKVERRVLHYQLRIKNYELRELFV
jgi:hypothetical protein